MATLVLRLAGPMQAWGLSSRFGERDTARAPTKSGVLGLLCAALGRDRGNSISDLAALRFAVLVDRPGQLQRDYHTALDVAAASGSAHDTVVTNRFYLADAAFWGALEGPRPLLESCQSALRVPTWPIFLGRKACAPGDRVWLDDQPVDFDIRSAVAAAAGSGLSGTPTRQLIIEDPSGTEVWMDQPLSTFAERHYGPRRVAREELRCV